MDHQRLDCEPAPDEVRIAGDCDDTSPLAWEGAPEVACDGVDNDCDGFRPQCARRLDDGGGWLQGWDPYEGYIGDNVAFVGDVDGDGAEDVALLAYVGRTKSAHITAVNLVTGTDLEGARGDARDYFGATLDGPGVGQLLLGAGDVDGDGLGEVWVGAEQMYLLGGGLQGEVDMQSSSIATIDWYSGVSRPAASWGDADGDGVGDLLVADDSDVYLFRGPFQGAHALEDAVLNIDAGDTSEWMNTAADMADFDGDGIAEILLGTDCYFEFSGGNLSVAAVDGSSTGSFSLSQDRTGLDFWIDCVSQYNLYNGARAVGDVNGDGYVDLGTTSYGIGFYLVAGPLVGAVDPVEDALVTWLGFDPADKPHGVGDVDGDGLSETLAMFQGWALDGDQESDEAEFHVLRGGRS